MEVCESGFHSGVLQGTKNYTARHPDHADNVVLDLVAVGSGTTTKSTNAVVYPDLPVESPREKA